MVHGHQRLNTPTSSSFCLLLQSRLTNGREVNWTEIFLFSKDIKKKVTYPHQMVIASVLIERNDPRTNNSTLT